MKTKRVLGDLIDVGDTGTLLINDTWVGLSPIAPTTACYRLQRGPRGNLRGTGWFSIVCTEHRVIDVAASASVSNAFFEAIAKAPIRPGAYEPEESWTDDYPSIEVVLHLGPHATTTGVAFLFTKSQGEFHAPWGACIDGELWTLPDKTVGRALASLYGPLRRATLGGLVKPSPAPRRTQKAQRVARRLRA